MRKSKHLNFTNSSITALIIIAIGLAAALYIKENPLQSRSTVKVVKTSAPELNEMEKAIYNTPGMDSPDEVKRSYSTLITKNAVEGNTLVLKDCKASPMILRIPYGSDLTVKNEGKTDTYFGFGDKKTLVKAGSAQKITTNFKHGVGIYGYGCDDQTIYGSIGVLQVM